MVHALPGDLRHLDPRPGPVQDQSAPPHLGAAHLSTSPELLRDVDSGRCLSGGCDAADPPGRARPTAAERTRSLVPRDSGCSSAHACPDDPARGGAGLGRGRDRGYRAAGRRDGPPLASPLRGRGGRRPVRRAARGDALAALPPRGHLLRAVRQHRRAAQGHRCLLRPLQPHARAGALQPSRQSPRRCTKADRLVSASTTGEPLRIASAFR
jgi:hypothetical protein